MSSVGEPNMPPEDSKKRQNTVSNIRARYRRKSQWRPVVDKVVVISYKEDAVEIANQFGQDPDGTIFHLIVTNGTKVSPSTQ